MKKTISAFILLLILLVLSTYLFFPAQQTFTQSIKLHVPQKALQRVLMEQSMAQKQKSNINKNITGAEQAVLLLPDMYNGFILRVPYKNTTHNSLIRLMTLNGDTTFVHWNAVVRGGNAPWQRIQTWNEGRQIKSKVQAFLSGLRQFEQDEQLYGFAVNREKVKHTAFMATRFITTVYPTSQTIYEHITHLAQYIQSQGAMSVGYPMLHVQKTDRGFEAMVALPTNKALPGTSTLEPKRMIMGNILSAEIKGGNAKVERGMKQLQYYVTDHGYTSPAIPFLSLITDRTKEPDSAKWITKLYYPIM